MTPLAKPCVSCGAQVIWVPTAASSRPMPLDAEPRGDGNVVMVMGTAHIVGRGAARVEGQVRYMPHHATCPQGKAWQGRTRLEGPRQESLL